MKTFFEIWKQFECCLCMLIPLQLFLKQYNHFQSLEKSSVSRQQSNIQQMYTQCFKSLWTLLKTMTITNQYFLKVAILSLWYRYTSAKIQHTSKLQVYKLLLIFHFKLITMSYVGFRFLINAYSLYIDHAE